MGDRAVGLVLPVSILVSVAVGAVIGGMFARTSAAPAASGSLSIAEVKELTEAIHALRLEMVRTHGSNAELTAPPATSASSRTEASPDATGSSADAAKDLRAATADLAHTIEALNASLRHLVPDLPPPVFPSIQADVAAIDAAALRTPEENNRAYLFRSYQQVIDAFGTPEGTGQDKQGAIMWWYNHEAEGAGISFWFVEGRVIRVEANKN